MHLVERSTCITRSSGAGSGCWRLADATLSTCPCCLLRLQTVEPLQQLFVFFAHGLEIIAELLHFVRLFTCTADRFNDLCHAAFHSPIQVTAVQTLERRKRFWAVQRFQRVQDSHTSAEVFLVEERRQGLDDGSGSR